MKIETERWEIIPVVILILLLVLGLGLLKCGGRGVRKEVKKAPLEDKISEGVKKGIGSLNVDVKNIRQDVKSIRADIKNIRRVITAPAPVATAPIILPGPTTERIKTKTVVERLGLIIPPPKGMTMKDVEKTEIGGEKIKPGEIKKIYLTGRKGTYRIYLITGEVAEVDYEISPGEYLVKIAGEEEK